jgi:predicted metal-binding protein
MALNNIDNALQELCGYAIELGASRAKFFDAAVVVVDERVRLKCRVPLCDDYGIHLQCPPNVPSVNEMQELVAKYNSALLLQLDYPISGELKDIIRNKDSVTEIYKSQAFKDEHRVPLDRSRKRLHEIVNKVEAKAYSMGFYFAAGFIGGSCKLCAQCVTQQSGEPCQHPFQARPSIEAVGIDAFKTAKNIGFELAPPKDIVRWTGLILVD